MEQELTERDQRELLNLLSKGIPDKWHLLGVQLQLSTLSRITESDPVKALNAVISEWLKGNGSKPTPKNLAEALKSESIGEPRLAERIENKYGEEAKVESATDEQSSSG